MKEIGSMFLMFFTIFALVNLYPIAANAAYKGETSEFGTVIGIDLGTTYSCVGVQHGGRVEIIANDQGHRITPSWVSFFDKGRLIGNAAKNAFHYNPENTVFDVKRLIGRKMGDPTVKRDQEHWPFKVIEKNGKPAISVKYRGEKRDFSPEEISAMILIKMKEIAEVYLGKKVTHAVVTVPAHFNDAQRQATMDAGTIAGLQVLRIINEPMAAAIAYGLDKRGGESKIIVYDLGGGSFDVSLLSIDNGVFKVLATAGNAHLGGEDFNHRVINYFVELYKKKTGTDVSKNFRAISKLKREVEKAKRTLSSQQSTRIHIESFGDGNDFFELLTRAKFEELNVDLFKKTIEPVEQVLKDTGLEKEDIDQIVLVGGSTRIPKIQWLLKEYFGKEPYRGINPDEAVAYGAAVQGGILTGDGSLGDVVLVDVNPLTLGIETTGGVMSKLIPRNTAIPTRKDLAITTGNQPTILIPIFEGEHSLTKDNNLLCKLLLTYIPPAPRGMPQIEVTLEIDANGIMKVSAADKDTGKPESVTVINEKGRFTQEEIDRMVAEAEEFSAEDEARKQRIEALDSLSSYIYNLKSQLGDSEGLGGKLDDDDKKTLLDALESIAITIEKGRLAQGVYLMAGEAEEIGPEDVSQKKLVKAPNFQPHYAFSLKSKLSEWIDSTIKLYSGSSTPLNFPDGDDEPIHDEL